MTFRCLNAYDGAMKKPDRPLKPGPKPSITGDVVRTSLKLHRPVWVAAHKLALDRDTDLAVIVNEALLEYLGAHGGEKPKVVLRTKRGGHR